MKKLKLGNLYRLVYHFRWFIESLNDNQKRWFLSLVILWVYGRQVDDYIMEQEQEFINQILDWHKKIMVEEEK